MPTKAAFRRLFKGLPSGKLAENTFLGTFWQLTRIALQVLSIIIIARAFGPDGYGMLAGATGLATSMGCIVGLGTGFLLLRAVSRNHDAFSLYWRKALSAISISGLALAMIFCLIASAILGARVSLTTLVLISLSELILYPYLQLSSWAFQAHERLGWANVLLAAMAAARLIAALLFVAVMPRHDLNGFLWLNLAASFLMAAGSLILVYVQLKPRSVRASVSLAEVKEGLGFTAQYFTSSAMSEIDKTLVLRLAGSDITGLYAAAYRLVTALSLPIGVLTQAALPRLFRSYQDKSAGSYNFVRNLLLVALAYSIAGMILLQALATVLPMILGPSFAPSVDAGRWLALWLPCYGLRAIGSAVLMTSGHQLLRAGTEIVAVLAMFGFALVAVPKYGLEGAVAVAILTEAMLAILTWAVIWRSQTDVHAAA